MMNAPDGVLPCLQGLQRVARASSSTITCPHAMSTSAQRQPACAQLGMNQHVYSSYFNWHNSVKPCVVSTEEDHRIVSACRLADVIQNALLKEQARGPQPSGCEGQRLSQAAEAIRNSSALQQMASQVNKTPQEVCLPSAPSRPPLMG